MEKPQDFKIDIPDNAPLPYSQYKEHNGDICKGYFHYDTGQLMILITDFLPIIETEDGLVPQFVLFPLGYLKKHYDPLRSWMFGKTR